MENIELVKKEIRFRARRGMKETDLIIGRFVERHLEQLNEPELHQLRELLLQPDADIWEWLATGAPQAHNSTVWQKLVADYSQNR